MSAAVDPDPPCSQFTPAPGGAHPWCDTCGWQRRYHATPDRVTDETEVA